MDSAEPVLVRRLARHRALARLRAAPYAQKKGVTPSQIALAWLLANGPNIVPIPGTRKEAHLLENLGAQNMRLTDAEVQEIETSLLRFPVYGNRMGEAHMSQIDYTV